MSETPSGESSALPSGEPSPPPSGASRAWLAWLEQISRDEGCALGAAHAYRELGDGDRDGFLTALEQDAPLLTSSYELVLLPFLTVETDTRRRARLVALLMRERADCRARVAQTGDAEVFALETAGKPATIYIFHDPARDVQVDLAPCSVAGLTVCDFDEAIDRLAHAVVRRHKRTGERSESLAPFAHLFGVARND